MNKHEKWELLKIKTNYEPISLRNRDHLFSMLKNILSRIDYEKVFYLSRVYEEEDEHYIELDLFLSGVMSHRKVNRYLTKLDFKHSWEKYDRNHITEALVQTSQFCIDFEFLPGLGALGYILHCICENFFYTKTEEIDVYASLISSHNRERLSALYGLEG